MSSPTKAVTIRSDRNRLHDGEWLSTRRSERWSVTRIAAELGVDHRDYVSGALRRFGLTIPLPVVLKFPQLHDVEWLTRALGRQCVEDVARTIGCTPQSVRYAARKYGVSVVINGHDLPPATVATLNDRAWLTSGVARAPHSRAGRRAGCDGGASVRRLPAGRCPACAPQRVETNLPAVVRRRVGTIGAGPQVPDPGRP